MFHGMAAGADIDEASDREKAPDKDVRRQNGIELDIVPEPIKRLPIVV